MDDEAERILRRQQRLAYGGCDDAPVTAGPKVPDPRSSRDAAQRVGGNLQAFRVARNIVREEYDRALDGMAKAALLGVIERLTREINQIEEELI